MLMTVNVLNRDDQLNSHGFTRESTTWYSQENFPWAMAHSTWVPVLMIKEHCECTCSEEGEIRLIKIESCDCDIKHGKHGGAVESYCINWRI
jgi:hypothetical protein